MRDICVEPGKVPGKPWNGLSPVGWEEARRWKRTYEEGQYYVKEFECANACWKLPADHTAVLVTLPEDGEPALYFIVKL